MEITRKTLVHLLSAMHGTREIQFYLKRFSAPDAGHFAVIKIGGAVLRDALPALVSSLALLQQLGLTPVVLHGAGPQLDEALTDAGIKKQTVEGLRITSSKAMGIVHQVLIQQNVRLAKALHAMHVHATTITAGVFMADYVDRARLGMVGKITQINGAPIEAALRVGSIPVLTSQGQTDEGQILNLNADVATNALVRSLKPYKTVFLTGTGGLLDDEGQVIDSINLSSQYDHLMAQSWLHGGMRLKIRQIAQLLTDLPLRSSVSITHPTALTRELFTHKGSGTLIRHGEKVMRLTSWQDLDQARLRLLIESGFGRRLVPDYFECTQPYKVYLSENYRVGLILTLESGVPYLDKFVVLREAQGEGLGRVMWEHMRQETPRLFWRSRRDNPFNGFYNKKTQGFLEQAQWRVFWYGLDGDFVTISHCVRHAVQRPSTLRDPR